MHPVLARLCFAALAFACASHAGAAERIAWVWDGAQAPAWSAGHAAVVLSHVHLGGDTVRTRPRLGGPMPAAARITPVVHVELSTVDAPKPGAAAREAILAAMRRAAAASTSGWVQLDMEARPSQRAFYLALVRELRAELPRELRLSVTALAWWCRSPAWLDALAADEVVPMLFRLGADGARLKALWQDAPGRLHPRCRTEAVGVATVEPLSPATLHRYGRVYAFDRHHWRRTDAGPGP